MMEIADVREGDDCSPGRVDRTGRTIVLMPEPHDSLGKKVNEVNTHDDF